jgi:hypothetical protein
MTEETTTPDGVKLPNLKYGFAILVDEDANVFIEKSPSVFSIPVEREATMVEVRRYISEILMDLQAQAAAEYTALRLSSAKEEPAS